jgi:excisionase family DNA binding protein
MSDTFLTRPAADPLRLLLTTREAAESLGISPRMLWQLNRSGEIPCLRLPGRGKARAVRYVVEDLQQWIRRTRDGQSRERREPPPGATE